MLAVRIIGKYLVILSVTIISCKNGYAQFPAKETTSSQILLPEKSLAICRKISSDIKRLSCYDQASARFSKPTFKGRLGMVTTNFDIHLPTNVRYQSHGVIFVLYLRDKDGNVLQNYHLGGRGEDKFLIKQPGQYSLKIHGSAAWKIWIEPMAISHKSKKQN